MQAAGTAPMQTSGKLSDGWLSSSWLEWFTTPKPTNGPAATPSQKNPKDTLQAEASPVDRLGPFQLVDSAKALGCGGYAKVVLGKHKATGEQVAVKILSATPVAAEGRAASSEAAVVREVAALRRAGVHENVCRLHGYYRCGGEDAIVLELCRGGELFGLIERNGALIEADARLIFRGVLSGLAHLHAQGIAHRDLKLENIMLGGALNATPKICDLGLAHLYSYGADGSGWEETELTQCCGSRSYCAPEVLGRQAYSGFAADCWSLGVCLFGLVAGFFPVDEATTRDWRFERVACTQHHEPATSTCATIFGFYKRECPFSPALRTLCDGLLQVQPHRRTGLQAAAASSWVAGGSATGTAGSAGSGERQAGDGGPAATPAPSPESVRGAAQLSEAVEVGDPDGVLFRGVEALPLDSRASTTLHAEPPSLRRQRAVLDLA